MRRAAKRSSARLPAHPCQRTLASAPLLAHPCQRTLGSTDLSTFSLPPTPPSLQGDLGAAQRPLASSAITYPRRAHGLTRPLCGARRGPFRVRHEPPHPRRTQRLRRDWYLRARPRVALLPALGRAAHAVTCAWSNRGRDARRVDLECEPLRGRRTRVRLHIVGGPRRFALADGGDGARAHARGLPFTCSQRHAVGRCLLFSAVSGVC